MESEKQRNRERDRSSWVLYQIEQSSSKIGATFRAVILYVKGNKSQKSERLRNIYIYIEREGNQSFTPENVKVLLLLIRSHCLPSCSRGATDRPS